MDAKGFARLKARGRVPEIEPPRPPSSRAVTRSVDFVTRGISMPPSDNIKHLVVLMMENRSFDHMLGFAMSPEWPIDGLDGNERNRDSTGEVAQVSSDASFSGDFTPDPGHSVFDTLTQIYGDPKAPVAQDPNMSGFVTSYEGKGLSPDKAHAIMKCFAPKKVPVLTQLAQQFAVCDRWFSSVPGPTFPNRAFAHGATSVGRVDMGVNWLNMSKTIYELLQENGVDSRVYYHDSTMAMTFKGMMNQGKYFGDIDDFFSDCAKNRLPAYTLIEPRYANSHDESTNTFFSASDQHPDHNVEEGERLIQRVFEAVWKNKTVRESTLLVVVYDEHGGLYDHVPPPATVTPDLNTYKGTDPGSPDPPFDFTRLGVRVPAILISPYIPKGTIDHHQYEHASLVATACKLFLKNVPNASLTKRDQAARTFEDVLTLDTPRDEKISLSPSTVAPMMVPVNADAHLNAPINDHLRAHVELALSLEEQLLPPAQRSGKTLADIQTEKAASDLLLSVKAKIRALRAGPTTAAATGPGN
jgi:phospholipase C